MADLGSGGAFIDTYLIKILSDHEEAKAEFKALFEDIQEGAQEASGDSGVGGMDSAIVKAGLAGGIMGAVVIKALDAVLDTAQRVATVLVNLAVNFVKSGVEMNSTIQQLTLAFTTMTGSEEAAGAVLDSLREKAALLGQDFSTFARLARGLFPFAQGDIEALDEMLTLSQQLAVLDPVAGFRGAGRALREALSGNVRSLAQIFELPLSSLNELKDEFNETGDIQAFIGSLQELVGEFGVSADTIEAFQNTAEGSFAKVKFQFSEMQRILGAPVFAAITKHLQTFSAFVAENADAMKRVALTLGATLAVLLDIAVETFNFIIEQVKLLMVLVDQWNTIVELLQTRAIEIFTKVITDITGFFVNQINVMIEAVNRISSQLGLGEVGLIDFDAEKFSANIEMGLQSGLDIAKKFTGPFGITGGALGDAIFPDFGDRVQEYVDEFSGLLEANEDGWEGLAQQNEEFQESDLEKWGDYLAEVRDIFEKFAQDMEKANQRHTEKLESIQERALDKREDAAIKFNRKMSDLELDFAQDVADARRDLAEDIDDINRDIARDREDILRDATKGEQEIEQEHADAIREIRQELQRDLFDAVNARDARRVFELLQATSQAKGEANAERTERLKELQDGIEERLAELRREQQRRIQDAQIAFNREIADLQRNLEERRAEILLAYQRELEDIQRNLERQLEAEQEAHEKRMAQLEAQQNERLASVARAWAEEGELTKEGLTAILRLIEQIFGTSGAATALIEGFNDTLQNTFIDTLAASGLTAQEGTSSSAAEAQAASAASIASGESVLAVLNPETGVFEFPDSSSSGGGGGGSVILQHGFSGVVDKPTKFEAGDVPEFLFAQPLSRLRRMGRSAASISDVIGGEGEGGESRDINVFVRADRNFSIDFEASLENKIARVVGSSISGRRRTRRG